MTDPWHGSGRGSIPRRSTKLMILPTKKEEKKLYKKGTYLIAGVDEAGRGPLAGPVVSAAVVMPAKEKVIGGIRDSKMLSEKKREELFPIIMKKAVAVGVGIVSEKEIDRYRILRAALFSMKKAVLNLKKTPEYIFIDGRDIVPDLDISQKSFIQGDKRIYSIASASIIAKVTRDRIMRKYHSKYPQYGFDHHKGYGTKAHFEMLKKYGPCPIHRRSFRPVKRFFNSE